LMARPGANLWNNSKSKQKRAISKSTVAEKVCTRVMGKIMW
jgi:hypothetical protein